MLSVYGQKPGNSCDILAALVCDAFAQSHIPLNILGGFKKAGIYPINPEEVSDQQLAPSKALTKLRNPSSFDILSRTNHTI